MSARSRTLRASGTDMIYGRREKRRSHPRDAAESRLQAEQAAEGSGYPDRSARVSAQADRHKSRSHRGSGASRRAARRSREIVGISRRAVMRVFGGEPVRVLVHVQRADEHRSGITHCMNHFGICASWRIVAVDLRARERGQPGDVKEVLDREWHTRKRPRIATGRYLCVDSFRVLACLLVQDMGEGVVSPVCARDSGQSIVNDRGRTRTSGPHRGGDRGGIVPRRGHAPATLMVRIG